MASTKKENVSRVHDKAPDPPPELRLRWIVPHVAGPAYAHAMTIGPDAPFTMCKGHRTEGAVYPPAPGVPKCPACTIEIDKRQPKTEEAPANVD